MFGSRPVQAWEVAAWSQRVSTLAEAATKSSREESPTFLLNLATILRTFQTRVRYQYCAVARCTEFFVPNNGQPTSTLTLTSPLYRGHDLKGFLKATLFHYNNSAALARSCCHGFGPSIGQTTAEAGSRPREKLVLGEEHAL